MQTDASPSVGFGAWLLEGEKCYLVSKVWHDSLSPERLHANLEATLKAVGSTYLVHWPNSEEPIEGTLDAGSARSPAMSFSKWLKKIANL